MFKVNFLGIIGIVCLLAMSCEPVDRDAEKSKYDYLPQKQQEQVAKIDKQIEELHEDMEKYMFGFREKTREAADEVYGEWRRFGSTVEEAAEDQEKLNEIRERIVELQQKKIKILENHAPQK